ncbi:MAG: hypothetical protein LBB66_04340 [Desulfovibrio sp.]|jgi:NTP pyrophosphatase (non-canonical NTP hydrolase)|nr:hypothetical protein [Desulfovibrio sp.]
MSETAKRAAERWYYAFQDELVEASEKHPDWPSDVVHAAAILQEEAGELIQAALDYYYGKGDKRRLIEETVQCGAMAIRFLLNIENYTRGHKV